MTTGIDKAVYAASHFRRPVFIVPHQDQPLVTVEQFWMQVQVVLGHVVQGKPLGLGPEHKRPLIGGITRTRVKFSESPRIGVVEVWVVAGRHGGRWLAQRNPGRPHRQLNKAALEGTLNGETRRAIKPRLPAKPRIVARPTPRVVGGPGRCGVDQYQVGPPSAALGANYEKMFMPLLPAVLLGDEVNLVETRGPVSG